MSASSSFHHRDGLEGLSLAPATHKQYHSALLRFCHYRRTTLSELRRRSSSTLDRWLTAYLNSECRHGGSYAQAAHAVFGLLYVEPRLQHRIPRARRALKGWDRHRAQQSHTPLTWELTVLIALTMARWSRHSESVATLLAFDCYLRISEFTRLTRADIASAADPRLGAAHPTMALRLAKTKTGLNKFVTVDDSQVATALQSHLDFHRFDPSELVFPFTPSSYRSLLHAVTAALGLSGLHFVPHSLRHGGATRDFLRGRSIEQIMHRGRWASTKSAARYVQQGPALLLQSAVPESLVQAGSTLAPYLARCIEHLRCTVLPSSPIRHQQVRFVDSE